MEEKAEYAVEIAPKVAVGDGFIEAKVVKFGVWDTISWNRQKTTVGANYEPYSKLVVRFPIKDTARGQPITPEQVAVLLEQAMRAVLPSCKVFVTEAAMDFGYQEEEEGGNSW